MTTIIGFGVLGLFQIGSMWTYDVTHYMVVNLDVIIALASMACVFVGHIITSYILWMKGS